MIVIVVGVIILWFRNVFPAFGCWWMDFVLEQRLFNNDFFHRGMRSRLSNENEKEI